MPENRTHFKDGLLARVEQNVQEPVLVMHSDYTGVILFGESYSHAASNMQGSVLVLLPVNGK
jgi:hypothetical protein